MDYLPKNWAKTNLGELGTLIKGVTYKKEVASRTAVEGFVAILRANNINSHINSEDPVYVPSDNVSPEQFLKKNDILIAMSSGSKDLVGKAAQSPNNVDAAFGAFCGAYRPTPAMEGKFIGLFFHSPFYRESIRACASGIGINNLRREHIANMQIPVPPLAEQKRIVAKIERLFTDLDAGVAALKKTKVLIKQYRQSVLKSAFEGKFTDSWRRKHCEVGQGDFSSTWKDIPAVEVFEFVTSGSRGWARYYSDDGALFLRMGNLDHDSIKLDLKSIQYVRPPIGAEGSRTRVKPRDILISITADIGMLALIEENIGEAYINQHIALLRPKYSIDAKFLAYYLVQNTASLKKLQRGATKMSLGLDDIRNLTLTAPNSTDEQREVVEEIESRFSIADAAEKTVDAGLKQAERLRQSILKKAFGGKLVPQDPADEPAEILLQRIKGETAQATESKTKISKKKVSK